ncbi:hypothetical protein [Streptomyces wedmorensis]
MGLVMQVRLAPVLRAELGEALLQIARHHVRLRHMPKPFGVQHDNLAVYEPEQEDAVTHGHTLTSS